MRGSAMGRWALGAPLLILALAAGPLHGQVSQQRIENAARLLEDLVETYGVSGDEGEVRKEILDALPGWADPEVDSAGNVWVRVGQGEPVSVFVAHMDETGFQITEIGDDGLLTVRSRGGFLRSLWEGTPAIVHQEDEPINGVFVPRRDISEPSRAVPPGPTYVDVGARSRAEAEAMGMEVGQTVTNPKEFVRLAGTRATGRSFDDRVSSAAQILALQDLDPAAARHEFVFLWVVEEEIGLVGSAYAARTLGFDADRVYPVDTFVSADTPIDPQNFAVAPSLLALSHRGHRSQGSGGALRLDSRHRRGLVEADAAVSPASALRGAAVRRKHSLEVLLDRGPLFRSHAVVRAVSQ